MQSHATFCPYKIQYNLHALAFSLSPSTILYSSVILNCLTVYSFHRQEVQYHYSTFTKLDNGKLEVLRLWVNLLAVRQCNYRKHKQHSLTPLSILTVAISSRLPQWTLWMQGQDLNLRFSAHEADEITRLLYPAIYIIPYFL